MRWSFTCEQRETGEQYQRLACPHERRFGTLFYADERIGMHSHYPLLSVESVRMGYEADDETNLVVDDVSFEVWAGEKVMLLGPPAAASPRSSRR